MKWTTLVTECICQRSGFNQWNWNFCHENIRNGQRAMKFRCFHHYTCSTLWKFYAFRWIFIKFSEFLNLSSRYRSKNILNFTIKPPPKLWRSRIGSSWSNPSNIGQCQASTVINCSLNYAHLGYVSENIIALVEAVLDALCVSYRVLCVARGCRKFSTCTCGLRRDWRIEKRLVLLWDCFYVSRCAIALERTANFSIQQLSLTSKRRICVADTLACMTRYSCYGISLKKKKKKNWLRINRFHSRGWYGKWMLRINKFHYRGDILSDYDNVAFVALSSNK